MVTKPTGRERGHQTQWAAQFAVASELCKRGYEVAFTSGHTTPVADLRPNRYFVLSQKEINRYVKSELARLKRPNDYPMTGITFTQAAAHEDAWAAFPQ